MPPGTRYECLASYPGRYGKDLRLGKALAEVNFELHFFLSFPYRTPSNLQQRLQVLLNFDNTQLCRRQIGSLIICSTSANDQPGKPDTFSILSSSIGEVPSTYGLLLPLTSCPGNLRIWRRVTSAAITYSCPTSPTRWLHRPAPAESWYT